MPPSVDVGLECCLEAFASMVGPPCVEFETWLWVLFCKLVHYCMDFFCSLSLSLYVRVCMYVCAFLLLSLLQSF